MHGEREGVIPHDYFVLCDLYSLEQRPATSPGKPHLRAFTGDFSLLPSVDVARKTRHSQIPPLPALDTFSVTYRESESSLKWSARSVFIETARGQKKHKDQSVAHRPVSCHLSNRSRQRRSPL